MILLAITLPVIGREGTIRRSPDCLFYQTMWLPSSGGKYRLTLVKMEQEWGRGRGKLLHKGPICAAQLCISIAKNTTCHIDTQYLWNRWTQQRLWREKGFVVLWVSLVRDHTLYLLGPWASECRWAQQPLLTLPVKFLIVRSWDHRFLTWNPCVDFRGFRTFLKWYGDIFLERAWGPWFSSDSQGGPWPLKCEDHLLLGP